MVGVVLILLVLFVIGPIGLFVVGAIWSALIGWLLGRRRRRARRRRSSGVRVPDGRRCPGQRVWPKR